MYTLLPQLVGRDQQGVGKEVAAHFATAQAWDSVLLARVSCMLPCCFGRRELMCWRCWMQHALAG
jgi:hypothetical protein